MIVLPGNPVAFSKRAEIANFAQKNRRPPMYGLKEYAEAGGLMSHGPSLAVLYHRAATYVDKILKGTRPGDLPVERPTKFELVINLRTAKAIGLTIPSSLLQRADQLVQESSRPLREATAAREGRQARRPRLRVAPPSARSPEPRRKKVAGAGTSARSDLTRKS